MAIQTPVEFAEKIVELREKIRVKITALNATSEEFP
jgi:hypothetical protein